MLHLPLGHGTHSFEVRIVLHVQAEDVQRIENGGQRIAQFMAESGQEFVLCPIVSSQLRNCGAELLFRVAPPRCQ